MTNTQKICNIIDLHFRARKFECNEVTKIVKFQAGRYLASLVKKGILSKEKTSKVNTYSIGPKWNERDKILMPVLELGYQINRVWDAILHQKNEFSISDIESYLKKEFTQDQIRKCLQNLRRNESITPVGWWNRERTYVKNSNERKKFL